MRSIVISRRGLLGGLALSESLLAAGSGPVAETRYGKVRGASVRGVHLFRGIPYGGPTEGEQRFLPPAKPKTWAGVRDGTITGPRCVQGSGNIFLHPLIGEYFAGGRADRLELAKQSDSENCLAVNVLTPGLRGRRPVMVYMHGGGFTGGSSALTLYSDGLPREQDIVLVGVNHRLNVFGYLYLGGLNKKYATGNAGQLDLIASLEWVRDNIAAFGGDPGNVTVFGESGGGGKVSTLLAMPGAKGLFHKAGVQSGSTLRVADPDTATARAKAVLAKLGLDAGQVEELHRVPADKLYAANAAVPGGQGPVVDGISIPQQTWDPKAPEVSAGIPLIVGNDKDETTLFTLQNTDLFRLNDTGLRDQLLQSGIAEGKVDPMLAAYRRDHPRESATDLYFRIATDRGTRRSAIRQAELKDEQGKGKVFLYYFQWNTPLAEGKIKAFHTADLPLMMRLVKFPESEQVSRQLAGAWAAFARTGDPSQKGLPWPAFDTSKRATMVFGGEHSEAVNDPDGEERVLVRDLPGGRS